MKMLTWNYFACRSLFQKKTFLGQNRVHLTIKARRDKCVFSLMTTSHLFTKIPETLIECKW